ncbi:MAG: BsuPI-related putative proteinase inhibitor [bacterium]|nr:BsuPI-related putative proteinase inhibitor [bacterium]
MRKTKDVVLIIFLLMYGLGCTKAQRLADLEKYGELKGTIIPATQVALTLLQEQKGIQQIDSIPQNGAFFIPALTPGSYKILVEAPNFQTFSQELTITADQVNEVNIILTPVSPPESPGTKELPESPPLVPIEPPNYSQNYQELITDLIVSKDYYSQGEKITLTLTLTNPKDFPLTIGFPYGNWHPYFILTDSTGQEVWFSLHHMGFICMVGHDVLDPGETWTHTETWDGRDNQGNIVAHGTYSLTAIGLGYELHPELGVFTKSAAKQLMIRPSDLSGFTGKILIKFKDEVSMQEARSILEGQGLSNLDFSWFSDTIMKFVRTVVSETEKAAIIQKLLQIPEIVDVCTVSDREA